MAVYPEKQNILSVKSSATQPLAADDVATVKFSELKLEEEDLVEYPSTTRLILISIGLCLAVFVVSLDNTIIATAIPTIVGRFNSLQDVGWYGSAYLLTVTSLQPFFGKLYANFSLKFTYLVAIVIFGVGSAICAAAPNSQTLIVGRAIAGIGGSGIFSGSLNIITYAVPLSRRAIYIGFVSSMFGIASVVGPLMGGAFTDNPRLTWRWCFWINLPFGAGAFFAILFLFKSPKKRLVLTTREKIAQIDFLGAILLIGGLTCVLLALQWGGRTYPWSNSKIWGLFIGFVLIIALFVVVQIRRKENAMIPPRVFTQRTVLVAALYTVFFSMAFYLHNYFLPFYFQAIKGTTAVGSGVRIIPYLAAVTVGSILGGGLITITGNYADFLWIGSIVFLVGSTTISLLDVDTSTSKWIGFEFLAGLGAGIAFQIPFLAAQAVLKISDVPIGTSIIMLFNSLGGAISISIAQNIFSNRLVAEISRYAPTVNPELVLNAAATHLREVIPANALNGVLKGYAKALDMTYASAIAFTGVAFFISLFIERISVKGKNLMAGGAA